MNGEVVFEDRELSWLKFNERVLDESARKDVPFCERLLFFHIFQTNLDEFFKVRVGSLIDRMEYCPELRAQLAAVRAKVQQLNAKRTAIWRELTAELAGQKVFVKGIAEWTKEDRREAAKAFGSRLEPVISTSIIGKHRTSPFIRDKQTYFALRIVRKNGRDARIRLGLVACCLPQASSLIPLVGENRFATVEDAIRANVKEMFGDWTIKELVLFRVTRSADINPDSEYDDEEDYREFMARLMKKRRRLNAVRLEVEPGISKSLLKMLVALVGIDAEGVCEVAHPFDFAFIDELRDILRNRTELFYPKFSPAKDRVFDRGGDIFGQIREKDRLLAYPYDSMQPFLMMLHAAAEDPDVIAVRMTLYRVARHSQVVEALVEAAENGKEVQVLVELKARFDEENNIEWSRQLERAGCQVIYGLDGYKVHSKLCQIIRKEGNVLRQYTQIGTGNYNEKTSRLYTDFALFTTNAAIGHDAALVFRALALGKVPDAMKTLLVSPNGLRNRVVELIDGQMQLAQRGRRAYIGLKMNAITDKVLIAKLYEASRAGVKIELIVRGICSLVPQVRGLSENIRVVSVVGRFLEHSRVYIFGAGGNSAVYIASADFMTRNTVRRVEIAAPVLDKAVKTQILDGFRLMLRDNCQAHELGPDSVYRRRTVQEGEKPLRSQDEFCRLYAKGAAK
ncbi:MAG: polyphosphate kinase 1 [Kiritimatiellia bacterium]